MNVLHVIANPKPTEESVSKQLAMEFFAKLMELYPEVTINNIDLYQSKPPFLNHEALSYFWKPLSLAGYIPTKAEESAANFSNNNVPFVRDADVLVLTLPVWLNSMPAILKAWLDQVFVPGALFSFDESGNIVPNHHIKMVVLLVASGGIYKENDPADGLTPAIRAIFNVLDIDNIQIAWADGQNAKRYFDSDERREMAIEAAQEIAEEVAALAVSEG